MTRQLFSLIFAGFLLLAFGQMNTEAQDTDGSDVGSEDTASIGEVIYVLPEGTTSFRIMRGLATREWDTNSDFNHLTQLGMIFNKGNMSFLVSEVGNCEVECFYLAAPFDDRRQDEWVPLDPDYGPYWLQNQRVWANFTEIDGDIVLVVVDEPDNLPTVWLDQTNPAGCETIVELPPGGMVLYELNSETEFRPAAETQIVHYYFPWCASGEVIFMESSGGRNSQTHRFIRVELEPLPAVFEALEDIELVDLQAYGFVGECGVSLRIDAESGLNLFMDVNSGNWRGGQEIFAAQEVDKSRTFYLDFGDPINNFEVSFKTMEVGQNEWQEVGSAQIILTQFGQSLVDTMHVDCE